MRSSSDALPWSAPEISRRPKVEEVDPPTESTRDLEAEVTAILEKARRQAGEEAAEVLRQARLEGLALGRAEAAAQAEEEAEVRRREFRQELDGLNAHYEQEWLALLGEMEGEMAELAWLLVEKLLGQIERSSLPLEEIRGVLQELPEGRVIIRTHPLDQAGTGQLPFEIETDSALSPGDFELVSGSHSVKGSLELRKSRLKEMLGLC